MVSKGEPVCVVHISALFDEPFTITKLDGLKELRQILLHFHSILFLFAASLFHSPQEYTDRDDQNRGCRRLGDQAALQTVCA